MFKLPFFKKSEDIKKLKQDYATLQSQIAAYQSQQVGLQGQIANLKNFISLLDEGLLILDSGYNVVFSSQKALDLLGYAASDLVGKKFGDLIKVYDKDNELTVLHLCPTQNSPGLIEIFPKHSLNFIVTKIQTGAQNKLMVNLTTKQFRDNKNVVYFALIIQDDTRSKELESMKLDFVSMAAHELRTPLTSINGYMSVYLSENKDKLTDDQKHLLDSVVNATQQLRVLVEDLLNISKIEKGILNINLETVDYLYIIQDTIKFFRERAIEKNIQFEFENKTSVIPTLRVDKVRINEVLTNLLSNAVKYTDPGAKIKLWLEIKDNFLITHVSDSGKGIDSALVPNLFNKFYRAVKPLDQSIKGTGLGLYIAKSIVEMHHGKIWVESELGKGSTFSYSIPL